MNHSNLSEPMPTLAPPGAGLPKPELFAARLLFRWHCLRSNRQKAATLIESERRSLLKTVSELTAEEITQRVLIQRLTGLEDSSRYWSVAMTLEHLVIVNQAVASTLLSLGRGECPSRVASTAEVKPQGSWGAEICTTFSESCHEVESAFRSILHPEKTPRYSHPWFGPLTAMNWYQMVGFHLRLHRRQAHAIIRGLKQ